MTIVRPAEDFSWWPVLTAVVRQRAVAVAVTLGLALAVGAATILTGRHYTATASFIAQEPSGQQGGLGAIASQFGLVVGRNAAATPQFYAELLRSKQMFRDVLLTEVRGTGAAQRSTVLDYLGVPLGDQAERIQAGIAELRSVVVIAADRQTSIVKISVTLRDPGVAAQVSRRFLDLIAEYNLKRRQSVGHAERTFVEERLSVALDSLRIAEDMLTSFYRSNRDRANSPSLQSEEQRLQRVVSSRQQLHSSLSQSLEAARIEEVRDTPVITVVEAPEGLVEKGARGLVRNTMLALVLGLVVGTVIAVLLERRRSVPGTRAADEESFRMALAEAGWSRRSGSEADAARGTR